MSKKKDSIIDLTDDVSDDEVILIKGSTRRKHSKAGVKVEGSKSKKQKIDIDDRDGEVEIIDKESLDNLKEDSSAKESTLNNVSDNSDEDDV